jgi:hypothetical protein
MFRIAHQVIDAFGAKLQFYADELNSAIHKLKIKMPDGSLTKIKFNAGGQVVSTSHQTADEIAAAKKAAETEKAKVAPEQEYRAIDPEENARTVPQQAAGQGYTKVHDPNPQANPLPGWPPKTEPGNVVTSDSMRRQY